MHTKRTAAGQEKGIKWTTTPRGPHRKAESIPLGRIMINLGYADKTREAHAIIVGGMAQVDGVVRKDKNYGVGLMDVVSIPKVKKDVRLVTSKAGIVLKDIDPKEAKIKPCKIIGKRTLPGGKTQLTLHDGTTILCDKKVAVNDTAVLESPGRKLMEIIPYETGNQAVIVSGRHRGYKGELKEVVKGTAARGSLTKVGDIQTLTEYVFVIGRDKPVVDA